MLKEKIKSYIKWILRGEIPTSVLIKRGLKVGKNFNRQRGCIIDPPHCWLISIGDNVVLAPNVHILAHDGSTKNILGYTKIGKVSIGNNVFVGAETLILPNTKIGDNCIIGASSVITKNIPSGSVVAGNPAKIIMSTEEYIKRNKQLTKNTKLYDESYTLNQNISSEKKEEMKKDLENKIGYII